MRKKILSENKLQKKIVLDIVSHFPVLCLSCLRQIDVYHHQVAKKYRN